MNILIVEDNRHMRRMLGEIVRAAFVCEIFEATDALSAIALCREIEPELILMDVGLPGANGIELTARIKTIIPDATIVIVSNHRTRWTQEAARAAGASGYVFKDDVYDSLLTALAHGLAERDPDEIHAQQVRGPRQQDVDEF